MRNVPPARSVALTVPLVLGFALPATAQPTTAARDMPQARHLLEEVVVTARRRDENLQDVPQVVNVISGDAIQRLQLLQFEDIENAVPGLTLSSEGVISRAALRGVTFQPETRSTATVEFYLNEALVESNYLFKSLFDVRQIEVLRGPQGTLRGRSAPSGAITINTVMADPSGIGGYISATGSDRDAANLQGALNLPLIGDRLALRVAGLVDETALDGVRSVNSRTDPEQRTEGGRLSLRFTPIEVFDLSLMYQYLEVEQDYFHAVSGAGTAQGAGLPTGYNGPRLRSSDRRGITTGSNWVYQRQEVLIGHANWRFGSHQLSYVGSYSNRDEEDLTALDRGNLLPADELYQDRPNQSPQRTHELRLASIERLANRFDYTVGVFASKTRIRSDFTVPANFLPGAFGTPLGANHPAAFDSRYLLTTTTSLREESREASLFGSLTWYVTDATELTIGGRQIRYKGDSTVDVALNSALAALPGSLLGLPSCASAGLGTTYPGTCDVPSALLGVVPGPFMTIDYPKSDETPFVYNISLSHRFTDNLMVYGSVGSAWRRGLDVSAEINNAGNNPVLSAISVIDPERSRAFEIGFKSSWLDGRGMLDVALFHQTFDGLVLRTQPAPYLSDNGLAAPTVVNRAFTVNADAVVKGAEITATLALMPQWMASAAFSYADGRVDDDDVPCRDANFDGVADAGAVSAASFPPGTSIALCHSDEPISGAPKWNATLQTEYFIPLAGSTEAYLRGLYNYYPSNDRQSVDFTVDSHGILNLYLGLRDAAGAWDLSLFVKNATGTAETLSLNLEEVESTGALQSLFGPTGYRRTSFTQPREVGLSVRYAFGNR